MSRAISCLIAAMWLFLSVSVSPGEPPGAQGEVRSPTGKLLYKTKTTGNATEVRDPTGKLLMKSKTSGDRTEVRSPTGKLLETIKTKR